MDRGSDFRHDGSLPVIEVRRGQIWWVEFGQAVGSATAYRRPALVVQSDAFNASRISTVLVAPMTTNLRLADAPGNVLITKRRSGLPKDSVINVSLAAAIDRASLAEQQGRLDESTMSQVDRGLCLVFGL